jgi:hypothetical protein
MKDEADDYHHNTTIFAKPADQGHNSLGHFCPAFSVRGQIIIEYFNISDTVTKKYDNYKLF